MKYIVYKTTNLMNNYIYIGVHKTKDPNYFDGYLGCGVSIYKPDSYLKSKTKFLQAVKEFGCNNFKRETLFIFDNDLDAYTIEEELVTSDFLSRPDVYNMVKGGCINRSNGIKVFLYDSMGKFIIGYDNYSEASNALGLDSTSIRRAAIYKFRVLNKYYFSTDKLDQLDLSLYNTKDYKTIVYRYLKTGDYDREFDSYNEAARDSNISASTVRKSVLLGYCVSSNYYFSTMKRDHYDSARTEYIKTREVHKYDSNGNYICSYTAQLEAEQHNPYSNITRSIKLKSLDSNNFFWSLERLENYNCPKKLTNRKVGMFREDDSLIKTWDSARSCCREVGSGVLNILCGRYSTHKGFIYKYIDN